MRLGPRGRAAARRMRARLAGLNPEARAALPADLRATADALPPGPAARRRAMLEVADPPPRPKRNRAIDADPGPSLAGVVVQSGGRHPTAGERMRRAADFARWAGGDAAPAAG